MQLKGPLKNTLAAGTADAASRFLGFLATAYLARVLGTSYFGMMSIAMSILSYAVMLSNSGLQVMGIREVASTTEDRSEWTGRMLSLRSVLAVLCILLIAGCGLLTYGYSEEWLLVVLFVTSALPMAFLLDWYFQGKGNIVAVSGSKVLMYCVYLPLLYILVNSPNGILWTSVAFAAANWASTIFLLALFYSRVGTVSFSWSPAEWWLLLKTSFPLGLSSLLAQTIINIPILLVGAFASSHDTGLFSASMKLIFFVLMVDRVFYTLFFPVISRYRAMREGEFTRLVALGMKTVLVVSVPILVVGEFFAGPLISLVFGAGYDGAAGVLQWLLPYVACTVINTVLMCTLYADQRETDFLRIMMIGTTLLVALCAILTPTAGIEGAALGLSAGEGVMTVLLITKVKSLISLNLARVLAPAITGGLVMSAVLVLVRFSPYIACPTALVCFAVILRLLGGVTGDDIRYFRERFV